MYRIVYSILYLISLIPLRGLYIFSDFLYFLVYRVFGYRKETVMSNLTIVFPEKTEAEKKKIAKDFYKVFVDSFVETIKLLSASEEYIVKRFDLDTTIIDEAQAGGRSCEMYLQHNFNWEWCLRYLNKKTKNQLMVAYMPLSSKIFDKLYYDMRTRFGCLMLPATSFTKAMMPYRKTQLIMSLVGDQNPGSPQNSYWLNFFGRPTPFLTGPEKNARLFKVPVVFMKFARTKRGYYKGSIELAAENVNELPEGELTIRFVRYLEQAIREHPENWLWTHRRWKYEWKDEYEKLRLEPLTVQPVKAPAV